MLREPFRCDGFSVDLARRIAASFGAAPERAPRPRWSVRVPLAGLDGAADLHTQLEELLDEVWKQETFERKHPFTCGVIREAHRASIASGMRSRRP